MYFPYFRGRQFELLALKELIEKNYIGSNIIPIIEPVKLSSTLCSTLETYIKKSHSIAIIHNPKVGSFIGDLMNINNEKNRMRYFNLLKDNYIFKVHQMNSNSGMELNKLVENGFDKKNLLVLNTEYDYLENYLYEFSQEPPKFTFIPYDRSFRRTVKENPILLNDKFNKQTKNSDYQIIEDEFFSDDHLFFETEGFSGFSDYSIIGNEYLEGGFAPYAVAIHIVYFDQNNNLKIRHFVSDSNDGINDPAKKFYEAVSKLSLWYKSIDSTNHSFGLDCFIKHYKDGSYPGLGIVKKLSIMHHLEIMEKFLGRTL